MMEDLISRLNLTPEKRDLAKTIAIFHDMGRFVQLKKTKHFDDLKTNFDHAKESVHILLENQWFEKNGLEKKTKDIIVFAIENHNKYQIAEERDPEKIYFAKLIRDADKLVILKEEMPTESSSEINALVWQDFEAKRLINRRNVISKAEEALSNIAFLFDLYLEASLDIVQEQNLLKPYLEYLQNNVDSKIYEKINQTIKEYLNTRKKEHLC